MAGGTELVPHSGCGFCSRASRSSESAVSDAPRPRTRKNRAVETGGKVVTQQGQVFELKKQNREGERLWAYRYRLEGRGSRRVQRGGFASEQDAVAALERELERVRR